MQSSFFGKNILEKINALTYTLSHDLRYLLPDFDVKTGIPRNYERIIRWPSITHSDFGNIKKTGLGSSKLLGVLETKI